MEVSIITRSNFVKGQNIGDPTNLYSIGAGFNWEIDFWGKYRHATRAAKQEMLAQRYNQRIVMLDLVSAVVSNYIFLLQFEEQLEIAQSTHESRVRKYTDHFCQVQQGHGGRDRSQPGSDPGGNCRCCHSVFRTSDRYNRKHAFDPDRSQSTGD